MENIENIESIEVKISFENLDFGVFDLLQIGKVRKGLIFSFKRKHDYLEIVVDFTSSWRSWQPG